MQRSLYTEQSLRRGVFTHKSLYTKKSLHRGAFAQSSFYTEKSVHRGAFTRRSFYTEELLRREVFTQKSFYTQKLLHREASTQRSLYTEELLHAEAFTQRSFSQTEAFTQISLDTDLYLKVQNFNIAPAFDVRPLFVRKGCISSFKIAIIFYTSFWHSNLISCERATPSPRKFAFHYRTRTISAEGCAGNRNFHHTFVLLTCTISVEGRVSIGRAAPPA